MEHIFNEATPSERPSHEIVVGKNKLIASPEDPYGFWYVHYERGETPVELQGAFTSHSEAIKAMETYLRKKKKLETADGST